MNEGIEKQKHVMAAVSKRCLYHNRQRVETHCFTTEAKADLAIEKAM